MAKDKAKPKRRSCCLWVQDDIGRMIKELAIDQRVTMSEVVERFLCEPLRGEVRKLRERQTAELGKSQE